MERLQIRKTFAERSKPEPLGHFVGWGPRLGY
jgi:hypothetical protein